MKPRNIILAGLTVLVLVTCLVFLLRPKEPSYQGTNLTEWLIRRWNGLLDGSGDDGSGAALKHIGTNAVPTLLKMVEAPRGKKSHVGIYVGSGRNAVRTNSLSPAVQRELAWVGFATLGTNAAPAIPKLLRLARHRDASVRNAALSCLKPVHPDKKQALDTVIAGLRDADALVELTAAKFVHDRYPEEMARLGVCAQVTRLTRSRDAEVRKKSLQCLGSLEPNRDEFLAVLNTCYGDKDRSVQWEAAKLLVERFPDNAERLGVYRVFPELKGWGAAKVGGVAAG